MSIFLIYSENKRCDNYEKKEIKMINVVSLILFAIAALAGVTLAVMYTKGKLTIGGALLHGLFAASGLVVLIISAAQGQTTTIANYALVLFVIAALGGAVLFGSHLKKGMLPKPLIGIHAAAAVIAFLMLLTGVFRK